MSKLEELRVKRPNLYRLACELSTYENPQRVLNALSALLSAKKGGAAGMNEKDDPIGVIVAMLGEGETA